MTPLYLITLLTTILSAALRMSGVRTRSVLAPLLVTFVATAMLPAHGALPPNFPTLQITRTPSPMVAGQPYTVSWHSSNAATVGYSCTAGGTGFSGAGTMPTVNGSSSGTAGFAWVGYPSTCSWYADGEEGTKWVTETMTTVTPPTISVQRTPSIAIAGQSYTLSWSSTNASSLSYSCSASGSGYVLGSTAVAVNGSSSGTASSAWVGYPSTCTWVATGPGGTKTISETFTTVTPPTISVQRTPSTAIAGQSTTLSWSSTNASSLSYSCSASGSGYVLGSTAVALNGSSSGTASSAWVGYPSTCSWVASGPGGTQSYSETYSTVAPPTISVSRNPSPAIAGQNYTTSWSSSNATSVSYNCTAGGTGYVGSAAVAVNGSSTATASAAWAGYPSSCTWAASGPGGTQYFYETLTTILPPTINVQRNPSPVIAGQNYTVGWSSTNATGVSYNCTASGTGYVGNASLPANGNSSGTASSAWIGYPSTCTWTASGLGGSNSTTETMTTVAPPPPLPTITVQRSPATMTAGQGYTLTWSSTDASSVTRVCTASGSGFTDNSSQAVNGSSSGSASSGWIGYPSNCTWTASNASGSKSATEVMTTVAAVPVQVITYLHTDGLGSPVARTNEAGSLISRTRYEPYGATAAGATPGLGFTGHVNDADTGLVYMQARYYDPVAGRFLSEDPVLTDANSGGSFNRYNYAANNPYKYIDPDGRDIMTITGGIRDDSINVFGHIGSAVQGNGMSSYGNGTPLHSSVADYLRSQSLLRPQQVTIVPTTNQQDEAARAVTETLSEHVGPIDNCAVRTNSVLNAAGIATSSVPLPKVTQAVAGSQPGATTYIIPKNGPIPKALLQVLPKFEEPPKKEESK